MPSLIAETGLLQKFDIGPASAIYGHSTVPSGGHSNGGFTQTDETARAVGGSG